MNKIFTLALLVPLLPVAAAAEEDKDTSKPCFRVDRVLHVDKIDDQQVLVKLRGGKEYILGVEARCRGLGNAVQYWIKGATTRACPDRLSRIAYREKITQHRRMPDRDHHRSDGRKPGRSRGSEELRLATV